MWHVQWKENTKSFYAAGNIILPNGKPGKLYLHRLIANCPNNMVVDHINHDTLDNTKNNLRIVTHSENQINRKNHSNKTAGITWRDKEKVYRAAFKSNKKYVWVGNFKTFEEAEKNILEAREKQKLKFVSNLK